MTRARRTTVWVAAGLAVLLVAATAWGAWTVRRSFPQTSGEVTVAGLERPTEVLRDEHGIPQVYADTAQDLFYTQGYVHAQDRFFEMDFRRHVVAGRLSELVGRDALDADVYVRSLGWYEVASEELAELDAASRSYLEAYADGVNAYLEGRTSSELSLEYAVLGITGPDYAPEPWTPTDSLAWLKALAWDLRSNMDDEIARVLAATTVTASEVEELYPDYPVDGTSRSSTVAPSCRAASTPRPSRRPGPPGRHRSRPRSGARWPRSCGPWPVCTRRSRGCWAPGRASAATPGSCRATTPTAVSRCWPTTRTWHRPCRASGSRWGCTAARSARSARSTSRARPSPACRAWSSATTTASPGG